MVTEIRSELERDIIGQVCWNSHAFFVASNYLTAGNFQHARYRYLWTIAQGLAQEFEPVDLAMIKTRVHDLHIKERGMFISRLDLLIELNTAADPRLLHTENLPFHCLQLVELGIREYIYRFTLTLPTSSNPAILKDWRDFQAHLRLETGHNDLFTLLERAQTYFKPYLPQLCKRLASCAHIISQKADRIKKRHGLEMIENTLKHYQDYA